MNVLVACESSGRVRDAFRARGHNAWSCDRLPCDADLRYHMQDDVLKLIRTGEGVSSVFGRMQFAPWDLMIAHPPCTYLCNSGVRWLYAGGAARHHIGKRVVMNAKRYWDMAKAAEFFLALWNANIPRICVENPIPHKYGNLPDYTQIVQPWQFGHGETKATCLWLKGLPPLKPTRIVKGRAGRAHLMSPGPGRSKERSKTYRGIAAAMARQWG